MTGRVADLRASSFGPRNADAIGVVSKPVDGSNDSTARELIAVLEERLRACNAERLELLLGIARLHDDELHARALYREVLAIDPQHLGALGALRRIALDAWDFAEAAQLLEREKRFTGEPRARAALLVELGKLRRDRLGDRFGARHAFEEAHAEDPTNEEAALAVALDCAERSDWSVAEPILERLVQSASEGTARVAFRTMEDELARREDFSGLSDLDALLRERRGPDESHRRQVVSAVDRTEAAIDEAKQALARDPRDVAQHRALYASYVRTGQLDRAYCVAAALSFLGAAEQEHRTCFEELRPRGVPAFKTRLGPAAWLRDLAHPSLDRTVGGVFEVIARAARATRRRPIEGVREPPGTTKSLAAKAFFGAATVLGLPTPELYTRADLAERIVPLPTDPTASVLGSKLLSGWSVPELMFVFGEHLVQHQGEHAVRAACGSDEQIALLFSAALHVVSPRAGAPVDVLRTANALRRELRPEELARLRSVVSSFTALGIEPDVEGWLRGSELTGVRAGVLLCGDLAVASKLMGGTEQRNEMIRFTVSDALHRLRKSLQIMVAPSTPWDGPPSSDDDEPTRERSLCA